MIRDILLEWTDTLKANVILTTGGTGFTKRDNTPEVTKEIIEKEAPGLVTAILMAGIKITPLAMLSRAVCGIRGETLIINLPGSPKAVKECLEAVAEVIPHAVDLILQKETQVNTTHKNSDSNRGDCCHKDVSNVSSISIQLNDVTERDRQSPYPMISMDTAEEIINNVEYNGETERIHVADAFGRILADDTYSSCNLPPFRASIKDGYAVLASDGKGRRRVLGGVDAGYTPGSVKLFSGSCVRINTGAPVPDEATAVVQVEDTRLLKKTVDGTEEEEIEILLSPSEGQDIRPIGSDIESGSLILKACTKIGAAEAGILAATGISKVNVTKPPLVGILSTGNELQTAGDPPKPGHIYDSNKVTLTMMLKENGYGSKDLGIAIDKPDVMVNAVKNALETVDVLITSGSVSMGDKDLLKPILQKYFAATIHFGRVNMKPGKPTTFATCIYKDKMRYILSLPGNPVSAMVTAHLFALPLLNRLSGNPSKPVVIKAELTSSYNLDPRPEYARAIIQWNASDIYPKAFSTGNQISSKLLSCKNANALLMLPGRTPEQSKLEPGEIVPAMLIGLDQSAR
ncbi:gephyrin isoform X2 [Orussus abietinus]|nr:gephyrin isoform X2 [Orussus abietinus]